MPSARCAAAAAYMFGTIGLTSAFGGEISAPSLHPHTPVLCSYAVVSERQEARLGFRRFPPTHHHQYEEEEGTYSTSSFGLAAKCATDTPSNPNHRVVLHSPVFLSCGVKGQVGTLAGGRTFHRGQRRPAALLRRLLTIPRPRLGEVARPRRPCIWSPRNLPKKCLM